MAIKYNIPRGTYDILPRDSYQWQYVENIFRQVATSFGYREIRTPIFEYEEVFSRSSGETSDIVQKEMYCFSDRKDRVLALRPEGTAPVIRSFVENNLGADGNTTKLFYIGEMFRYNRPQTGRSRQFSQFGAENIGSDNPYNDAELIALFYTYLQALGLQKFIVEINSIGCPDCSEIYNKSLRDYFSKSFADLCSDCQQRYDKNPKRLLDCKVDKCKELAANAPSILDSLDQKCQIHFDQVQSYLNQLKIPFTVNPKIVRGLDYYTQTAFEVIPVGNDKSQNAIGGGGRYNGLIAMMGGKDTPAIGFAGGFTRLLAACEAENLLPTADAHPLYYIVAMGDTATAKAIEILLYLRKNNIFAEFDIDKKSMKAQMKNADKMNAEYVIILGDDEIASQKMTIKNMKSGQQRDLLFADQKELLLAPK